MKKLSILLLMGVIAGCGGTKNAMPIDVLTGSEWELSKINGNTAAVADYGRELPYVIFSKDSKISGSGGCNQFSGSYNLNEENGVNISQIISTKMACNGDGERVFFTALDNVNMAKIDKHQLVLLNGPKEVATFVPKK